MRKILAVLAILEVMLILAVPVFADINQKAKMAGDNVVEIKVKQAAWNYGSGDVNQDIGVTVKGNYQMISQDSMVLISDSDYAGNINNTLNGTNIFKLNLDQYTKNMGSGNVVQGIDVAVVGNVQILDQDAIILISGE